MSTFLIISNYHDGRGHKEHNMYTNSRSKREVSEKFGKNMHSGKQEHMGAIFIDT
jgi:hypothetical protein